MTAPNPLDYISHQTIHDLWGLGYTVVRRRGGDPFEVPQEVIPQGRSYQWMHLDHDQKHIANGWAPVLASRHEGLFMPFGMSGDIEVNGLGLFEKPKFEVDADQQANIDRAHKQVTDWHKKWGEQFSGEVSFGGQRTEVGDTKTVENMTAIPRDMVSYTAHIFAERDALYSDLVGRWNSGGALSEQQAKVQAEYNAAMDADPTALKGPTLNSILLPTAIENVRKRITEEAESGKAS